MTLNTPNALPHAQAPNRAITIAYWATTALLCANLFGGVADILLVDAIRQSTGATHFPLAMLPFLGVLKIIGGGVLLFVKNPLLKIATYAGVVFYFMGAVAAHLTAGQAFDTALPAFITLIIAGASFWLWLIKAQVTLARRA